VRGRAADALGLIGAPAQASAAAIATASAACAPWLAAMRPDDESRGEPTTDACRLALFALARLRDYDALARVALDAQGAPVSNWWPVAYALQRLGDRRAADALASLVSTPGVYTAAFALRGLGSWRDARAAPVALGWIGRADADVRLRIASVRALAQVGGTAAVDPLLRLAFDADTPRNLALEATAALGALGDRRAFDPIVDRLTHPWPAMRLAAMTAAAKLDHETFLRLLSSLPPDADASVRAGLAGVLATLPRDLALPPLEAMAEDQDIRVAGAVLRALAAVDAPDLAPKLIAALGAPDVGVRAAAASLVGQTRPVGAIPRLIGAYEKGLSDAAPDAREAAIEALARYAGDEAIAVLRRALADPSWPIRLRAAALLRTAGVADARPQRPAPTREPVAVFESDAVLHPRFSPHAFIDTARGAIELELDVVLAPLTTRSFVELARAGFYNGLRVHRLIPHFVLQTGDPRGDGAGGPGYTIADELSPQPFVRGTVGMALSSRDDAGSQFFIALSPQPHLDGQYTVFGRVVAGWELLDQIAQGDVIERIRIWDGVTFR
jgi:cyclophilin family peptidyl-prolyl cis-trans isomerase/HEAT repeat protein